MQSTTESVMNKINQNMENSIKHGSRKPSGMNNEDSVTNLINLEPTQQDEELNIQDNEEEIGPIDDEDHNEGMFNGDIHNMNIIDNLQGPMDYGEYVAGDEPDDSDS